MKFYRYMSLEEFAKLSNGCDICGHKHHARRTSSNGVCFLGEHTTFVSYWDYDDAKEYTFSALDCYSFLSGIVSSDVLVEFEADSNILTESYGLYADPINMDYDTIIDIKEYCISMYNRDIMHPIRYTLGDSDGKFTDNSIWYDFN